MVCAWPFGSPIAAAMFATAPGANATAGWPAGIPFPRPVGSPVHADGGGPSGAVPPLGPVTATIEFRGPADMAAVRRFVRDHAAAGGLHAEQVDGLTYAVAELATNSVEHGAGQGRIGLWVTGHTVTCEVVDAGAPEATEAPGTRRGVDLFARSGFRPPTVMATGGRGLWLAQMLTDELVVWNVGSATHVRTTTRVA